MKKFYFLFVLILSLNYLKSQTVTASELIIPKAVMNDPVLEKKMIAACKSYWKEVYKTDGQVKKVYIMERKWTIVNDENTGAPLRKSIHAVLDVSVNNVCSMICVDFCCDHLGGGKYGDIYYFGSCYEEGSGQTYICNSK